MNYKSSMLQNFYNGFNYALRKKIYLLYLEQIVKHFQNPLTRNIDFQDIRLGSQLN